MITFTRKTLANGLKVLVHQDNATPMVCMNILYDVGARDEDPDHTGFAHLFEHLMFGGSINIPNYDEPLQKVGGENNAFTSNDITNYYLTLPTANLETAFWLESDRMLSLAFSAKSLEVQRSVVIEEFRQRYLNQPYGDAWLLLRPLAYKVHPYSWSTIGKEISHIEQATMEDVKAFFKKHYMPNNAIMVLSGNIEPNLAFELAEKWFGPIPAGQLEKRNLPVEPVQTEKRTLSVERDVPADGLYMVFHMCAKADADYPATDLLSDILARGNSSRFFNNLVKDQQLFNDINAYVGGDLDKGLFVVSGKLADGITMEQAEKGVWDELNRIIAKGVEADELTKVKNKIESTHVFAEMDIMNKAMNLAFAEHQGDANDVNTEIERYAKVQAAEIQRVAAEIFRATNASVLYYHAKK